ncbi:unnamed protein product [Ectocarpus sp. 6 AP-2014]
MANPDHAMCDRIDISRTRTTQDIGVVAVIDASGCVLAISTGHFVHEWVSKDVGLVDLGIVTITKVFHNDVASAIFRGISLMADEKIPLSRTFVCDIFFAHRTYVSILAQSNKTFAVEIEDFDRSLLADYTMLSVKTMVRTLTSNATQDNTVNDLCDAVFVNSSYDRAMTYKFLDDFSGEIIHEIKRDGLDKPSFVGQRFPAGDLPLPARKEYVLNPIRFIADVDKPSCNLLYISDDIRLTQSFLRGIVAPHKNYMRAMGVRSSLSIGVANLDGELWGLVTLHSYSASRIPTIEDRSAYAVLSSVASRHVQYIETKERMDTERRVKALVSQIQSTRSFGAFVVQNKDQLLKTFNMDSVSLFTPEGATTTVGEHAAVLADIPVSNEPLICGSLNQPRRSFVCLTVLGYKMVFTRETSYKSISWAGDPNELHLDRSQSEYAMPRRSFENYVEHDSKNAPPLTKRDKGVFSMTVELLKNRIHQIKIDHVEKMVAKAKLDSKHIEMKSDENYAFFANMSHELRTPLHAIGGVFDILHDLEDGCKYGELVRRYSKIGIGSCKDMMKTLNDILTIVKRAHEHQQFEVSLVTINDIFNSTSNGLTVFASKNSVSIDIVLECDTQRLVRTDVPKITQIYNNIAGNAIKFSDVNGNVEIRIHFLGSAESVTNMWNDVSSMYTDRYDASAHCEDACEKETAKSVTPTGNLCKWLVIQTRDEGCGIRQDDMSKIFRKFVQVGDVVTKKFASTGLGLHISLANAIAMRGRLCIASTPGEGTLLFCAVQVEDSGETVATTTRDDQVQQNTLGSKFGNDPLVFVVVDDSKVNVMIAKKQIERVFVNARVHTASDGKLGVELVERLTSTGVTLDGIFMDYHMPVMSGLEATRQIRKLGLEFPIAMLTADVTEISRQAMLGSGADFILLKPSRPFEIVEMCTKMIQSRRSITVDHS